MSATEPALLWDDTGQLVLDFIPLLCWAGGKVYRTLMKRRLCGVIVQLPGLGRIGEMELGH